MASTFFVNSYHINFESVLMIPDHDGMLNMFKALEASGLRGFMGCESVLYEKELEQFFETALLVNFSEVPKDKVYDARSTFSKKGVQVEIHGKRKHMKYEFRLLNDILAKAVTVKAGSFDAVTTERFQMMTAIHFGLKVNWSKVLFNVLKDMVDKSQRKAKGFAAQIGVLLKGIPAIALGEGVSFPFAKILSMKTVNTYIATNTTIDAREEQGMVSEATVKRTPKSKNKSSSTDDTPVKVISEIAGSKKRVATGDNASAIPKKRRTVKTKPLFSQASLDIVNVAQDVVPIQVIHPTSAVATIKSPEPKRKSRKRRLVLPTGSDDETMGTQELAKDTDEAAIKPTDEVDIIIGQVLEETLNLGVNEEEHGGQGVDETMFAEDFAQWLDDFVSRNSEPEIVGTRTIIEVAGSTSPVVVKDMNRAVSSMFTNEELMSIDDLLLQISDDMLVPSITATEITKIRLGESVSITEAQERDIYPASLPRISIHDKGKAILIRDQVMVDVVKFFHSFSLNTLSNFDALLELKEKEKLMLEWAETDSLAIAVKRKGYILAKYRELLLRKFLDSHRRFFAPGQPWTATTSQIIDLLSDAHSISLEDLLAQQRAHGLPMEQPGASTVFDSSVDSGVALARFYSVAKSTCWGMACHSFVDSVVKRYSGDIQEVNIKDVEEVDLVSSDGSTVYRSPSPSFQEVDSIEHDLQFALGPYIFPSVAQEERLYYVQSPESSPAISLHHESSSSSTDVSMHFDSMDIPVNAQADTQTSAPVDFTMFTDALEDLRSSISQRIHDSNCEILSKVNAVEIGFREALIKQHALLRQSLQDACRVQERQGVTQAMQINDLKKGLLAPVATAFQDLMAIKKGQREQDAKITALDTQVAAIRSEQLDFQSKIAADILSLSTQFGDIVDYIRVGDAKNGEGSSSRPPHSLPGSSSRPLQPPPADQIRDSGHIASLEDLEEAVERIHPGFRTLVGLRNPVHKPLDRHYQLYLGDHWDDVARRFTMVRWFGLQCPTSPLLPPRKVSLEDFDESSLSTNTQSRNPQLRELLVSHNDNPRRRSCWLQHFSVFKRLFEKHRVTLEDITMNIKGEGSSSAGALNAFNEDRGVFDVPFMHYTS
ncbi:hypothetical protein F511_38807 [Dorcoceras hygrometricum]|uniref:Dystroglycan-like n=1 Tax=Dorcoceras hygrometricum TaxID=472368 RepID=A0A2Z7C7E1_9LAMI|nr:hypothetical protein F511_38807 [Dorcoceras hygrometricum]